MTGDNPDVRRRPRRKATTSRASESDSGQQDPSRFVQRLQQDPQFSALIDEFMKGRDAQVAAFVSRLQRDPSFLAIVEEFTGSTTPTQPPGADQPGSAETWGWPDDQQQVVRGKKAAAAAVAAAVLVAGG